MRAGYIVLVLILLAFIISPVTAANANRYSYITVENVTIRLDNASAIIDLNYTVDENTHFIFFLLGTQDLENKLLTILNLNSARVNHINLTTAELTVDPASYSYGDGVFWYPTQTFNIVIPNLTVEAPREVRNFTMTNRFPDGMGYFSFVSSLPPPKNIPFGNEIPRP